MTLVSTDINQESAFSPAKPDGVKVTPHLADLKNGKVIFKQKPISFENLSETMQEIMSFRDWIETCDEPLSTFPDQHFPLIAKLVHESDKTIMTLTKTLQSLLLPPTLGSPCSEQVPEAETFCRLPLLVVEHAIKLVAERVNYGISTDADKHSAALSVWRWEVKNRDWLPKSVRGKVCERFNERITAQKHLQTIFDDLPEADRNSILRFGKNSKRSSKSKEAAVEVGITEDHDLRSLEENQKGEPSGSHESCAKKPGRSEKSIDPDTIAKDKERQERKAIKAEKEKKVAEATKKSAAAFANFFKSGTSTKLSKTPTAAQSQPTGSNLSVTSHLNEFQLTFKPFALKKDAHLAPVNWFTAQKRRQERSRCEIKGKENARGVIEVLEVEQEMDAHCTAAEVDDREADVSLLGTQEILRSYLETPPPSLHPIACTLAARRSFKVDPKHCVRSIIHQLNDAEVQGDQMAARKFTSLLKNRGDLPAKVLVFAENNRPGYLGTWTRVSSVIGPRTPFAQDTLSFDYDNDSDAEWEQEEEPEGGIEDVDSLNGSLEDDLSSTASDIAGWLVNSDDIEIETTNSQDESNQCPAISSMKRKAAKTHETQNKKRKVVPLIPFQKGPVWEKEIGGCEYEPFRHMRIQLFNDTPLPIDPFTFVSEPVSQEKSKPSSKDERVFVMPALPERLLPANPAIPESSTENPRAKRKPSFSPKTSFSDAHIPSLLHKIDASNTNSFVVLLDSLYQDMKALGIKKNALEVKLREVSEKDKTKKAWVVREQAWTQYGLIRPT